MRRGAVTGLAGAVAVMLAAGATARGDETVAEDLFQQGRAAMQQGDHARACLLFEKSIAADDAPVTRLNLARCYEQLGRVASAWTQYRIVGDIVDDEELRKLARQGAQALEPRLPRLEVRVADDSVAVEVDGKSWVVGVAAAIDPGEHVLSAHAEGRVGWSKPVVAVEGRTTSIEVPALAPLGAPGAAPPPPGPVVPERSPAERADALAEKGTLLVQAGRYREAAGAFTAAHQLDPRPIFLFWSAEAYRLDGDSAAAVAHYRRYLAAAPAGPAAGRAKAWVADLEGGDVAPTSPSGAPAATAVAAQAARPWDQRRLRLGVVAGPTIMLLLSEPRRGDGDGAAFSYTAGLTARYGFSRFALRSGLVYARRGFGGADCEAQPAPCLTELSVTTLQLPLIAEVAWRQKSGGYARVWAGGYLSTVLSSQSGGAAITDVAGSERGLLGGFGFAFAIQAGVNMTIDFGADLGMTPLLTSSGATSLTIIWTAGVEYGLL